MKRIVMAALTTLLATSPALADMDSALRAWDAGLYDLAGMEFTREAKAGDMEAQYRLGVMYADGIFYAKDRTAALDWLEKAAAQGHKGAIHKLEAVRASGPR